MKTRGGVRVNRIHRKSLLVIFVCIFLLVEVSGCSKVN